MNITTKDGVKATDDAMDNAMNSDMNDATNDAGNDDNNSMNKDDKNAMNAPNTANAKNNATDGWTYAAIKRKERKGDQG